MDGCCVERSEIGGTGKKDGGWQQVRNDGEEPAMTIAAMMTMTGQAGGKYIRIRIKISFIWTTLTQYLNMIISLSVDTETPAKTSLAAIAGVITL